MKHTLFILALLTASIQTFAQSPRIKLNQITKDSVTGSVLISSPTDSGMVYSRDLFISYGTDTVLILNGDTLAATSGIISSVLSDGVTITGDGTTGNELTADTSVLATLRALSDSLVNYVSTTELSDSTSNIRTDIPLIISDSLSVYVSRTELSDSLALISSSVTADGVTITGDGTVGSPLKVDTATVISSVGRLLDSLTNVRTDLDLKQDQLNGTGFVKATGTTISYDNSTYLTSEVDGSVTNEIQDISTTGAAGNISISSGSTLNLNVDDADASATNEGSLTVGAGGANDAVISSNTSGSSDVTISGGTNVTVTESGQTITISSTGGGGAIPVDTFVTIEGTETITGAKTFTNTLTQSGGDVNFDSGTFFVDESANEVGIGTTSPNAKMQVNFSSFQTGLLFNNTNTQYGLMGISALGVNKAFIGYIGGNAFYGGESGVNAVIQADGSYVLTIDTFLNTYLGNNTLGPPTEKLDVDGNARIRSIGSGASAGALHYTTNGTLTTNTSDVRLKTNLQPLENTLNKLLDINTYTFNWINETDRIDLGMVAQEVEEIFPQLVFTNPVDGYKGIHYDKFSSILTKAIQEQQAIIESQASEIETLKTLITELSNRLQILENN